jgi:hypothetical protein
MKFPKSKYIINLFHLQFLDCVQAIIHIFNLLPMLQGWMVGLNGGKMPTIELQCAWEGMGNHVLFVR